MKWLIFIAIVVILLVWGWISLDTYMCQKFFGKNWISLNQQSCYNTKTKDVKANIQLYKAFLVPMKRIEHLIYSFDRNGLVPEVGEKINEIIDAVNNLQNSEIRKLGCPAGLCSGGFGCQHEL